MTIHTGIHRSVVDPLQEINVPGYVLLNSHVLLFGITSIIVVTTFLVSTAFIQSFKLKEKIYLLTVIIASLYSDSNAICLVTWIGDWFLVNMMTFQMPVLPVRPGSALAAVNVCIFSAYLYRWMVVWISLVLTLAFYVIVTLVLFVHILPTHPYWWPEEWNCVANTKLTTVFF